MTKKIFPSQNRNQTRPVDQKTREYRVLSILDEKNEMSLVNLVAEEERKFHSKIRGLDFELLEIDESDLRERVNPTSMDNRIRMAFWYEVDLAIRSETKVNLSRIHAGLMARETFMKRYLGSDLRFAWMIRMLPTYEAILQEGVFAGLAQVRKMLDAPLYDENGKFVNANAKTVIAATKMFQDRLQGSVIQRSVVDAPPEPKPIPYDQGKMENLDAEIAKLENEIQSNKEIISNSQGEKDE